MSDLTRRELLAGAATLVGAAAWVSRPETVEGQVPTETPARPVAPDDATKLAGAPTTAVGARSPFVTPTRSPTGETFGSSSTPLQDLAGTITPADLHFERHHAGVPLLDPLRHELVVHGQVERPMVFSLADLQRLPPVTRTHFVECSGNGRSAFRDPKPTMTPQRAAGMTANSEWTGVAVSQIFREVGVQPGAEWFLAEGGDACLLARSIPVAKGWDDAMVVWAQNGEPLRPEQGYPFRLLLPGYEGNMCVKWLRRLELGAAPWMTRWETSKYTDPLPNGTAREFSFDMDAQSLITAPASPRTLTGAGWWPISGLAWSGRGRITRVEVSVDGGESWRDAELEGPVLPKAHTRFTTMWNWDGREAVLLSRATDETGYVQPTRTVLLEVRGPGTDYHFNHQRGWRVGADGSIQFHGAT